MKLTYVCNGDPNRIPKIGAEIPLPKGLKFRVESYGSSNETNLVTYDGGNPGYEIILNGALVVPQGAPFELLERVLDGSYFQNLKEGK